MNRRAQTRAFVATLLVASAHTTGCTSELYTAPGTVDAGQPSAVFAGAGSSAPPEPGCPPGFVEASLRCVLDQAAAINVATRFRGGGFVRANDHTFQQLLGPMKARDIYVSDLPALDLDGAPTIARELYRSIDPFASAEGLRGTFVVGTMLIHHNPNDRWFEVMVKAEPGFAPHQNDWWFVRLSDTGEVAEASPYEQSCMNCHVLDGRQERTDLVWGMPRGAIAP